MSNRRTSYYRWVKPAVFALDSERAHRLAIKALRYNLVPSAPLTPDPILHQRLWGLDFRHPVGLSAGFDKNAEALSGLTRQGFSFVEVGTITPLAQSGNPLPRLFRLPEDHAIINRLGFNNGGRDAALKNIERFKAHNTSPVIIGCNIGKNKTQEDAAADYTALLDTFHAIADYMTINISSPNTPGLRDLAQQDSLKTLLGAVQKTRDKLEKLQKKRTPVLLKLSPDHADDDLARIVETALDHQMDGLILTNTTIADRDKLKHRRHAAETGGLSGSPLFERSTHALRIAAQTAKGRVPLIGVGGILSTEDAYQKLKAGASLVQLYTGLIYGGFELVRQIVEELPERMQRDGFSIKT